MNPSLRMRQVCVNRMSMKVKATQIKTVSTRSNLSQTERARAAVFTFAMMLMLK